MSQSLPELAHDHIRPFLFATIINATLTGGALLQMFLYYTRRKGDPIWLKCFVAFSGVISCLSVVFTSFVVYTQAILRFGDAEGVQVCLHEITAIMFLPPLQSATVQLFFSWRASRLIGSRAFFAGVSVSAAMQVGCSIVSIIVDIYWPKWQRNSKISPTCLIWNSLACATDIIIAAVLIYHLRKRRTGHTDADKLLGRVALFTLQSGVLTAGWAVASLILFVATRDSISTLLIMSQPSLYANVLLAGLICRLKSEKQASERESNETSVTGSPEHREKSSAPITEVTFMSHGLRSEPLAAEAEQRTVDLEIGSGMTEIVYLDIRHHPEKD